MKTKITVATFLPTTSRSRHMDFLADLEKVVTAHKGHGTQVVISGPYHPGYVPEELRGTDNAKHATSDAGGGSDGGTGGGERSERQRAAAADFAEPEAPADAGKPAGGRKPRSDAGKPRGPRGGGAEASGSAAGQSGRGRGRGSAQGGDAAGGDGDGSAPEGGEQRGRAGEKADGGSGRGRGQARRADDGDAEASRVAAAAEDWGSSSSSAKDANDGKPGIGGKAEDGPEFDNFEEEEAWWAKTPDEDGWPDSLMPEQDPLTRSDMSNLMSDHFRAAGGKFREPTFDLLYLHFGADNLDEVKEEDYDKLARILLRDAAKYTYGVKKPVTTAPKKS